MVNKKSDVPLTIPKDLRARIKIAAAKARKTMRDYLDSIIPKE